MNLDKLKTDNKKDVSIKLKKLVKQQEENIKPPLLKSKSNHNYSFDDDYYKNLHKETYEKSCDKCIHLGFGQDYCEQTGAIVWSFHLDAFNCSSYKEPS